MRALLPTPNSPPSSRLARAMDSVHSGHRSMSVITAHPVSTDDAAISTILAAMVADSHGSDLTITQSTAKLAAKTLPGDKVAVKAKLKFQGTVASGDNAGASVKGKITMASTLGD